MKNMFESLSSDSFIYSAHFKRVSSYNVIFNSVLSNLKYTTAPNKLKVMLEFRLTKSAAYFS